MVTLRVYRVNEYSKVIQLMYDALFYRLEELKHLMGITDSAADVIEQIWQQQQIISLLNSSCSGRNNPASFMSQSSYLAGRYILPPLDPKATIKRWECCDKGWFLFFLSLLKLDHSGNLSGLIRTKAPLNLLLIALSMAQYQEEHLQMTLLFCLLLQ